MNRMELASRLVNLAKTMVVGASDHKQWAEILDIIKKTNRFGEEEVVDFMAEVWNGGLEQWVTNGKADQLHVVIGLAKKMGHTGQEMARLLYGLKEEIEDFDNIQSKPFSEYEQVDYDSATEPLDEFDDWFYKNDEKFQKEFFEYLTKDVVKAAAVKASTKTAGVWGLPSTPRHVQKIVDIVRRLKSGTYGWTPETDDDFLSDLYNILGADDLFDSFEDDKRHNKGNPKATMKAFASTIESWVEKMAKDKPGDYRDQKDYEMMQSLAKKLR